MIYVNSTEERAFRAYYRRFGSNADQPSKQAEFETVNGVEYVVLSNSYKTLAVYKIRNDGSLKYCKHGLPKAEE